MYAPRPLLSRSPTLLAIVALLAGPACGGEPDEAADGGTEWDAGADPALEDGGTDAGAGDAGDEDGGHVPSPAQPGLEPAELGFGEVAAGDRAEARVTVWNQGETACTFDVEVMNDVDLLDVSPLSGEVPAEGETTLTVACAPPADLSVRKDRTVVVYVHTDAPYPRHLLKLYATCVAVP